MTRTGAAEFVVPSDWSRARVRRHLAERLNLRHETTERGIAFYDTFDWLLHRAGYSLEFVSAPSPLVRLVRLAEGHVDEQPLDGPPPRFIRDWPRGPVKTLASRYTDVRALLPLVTASGSADRFAVLNRDGKTVCRIAVEKWRAENADRKPPAWSRVRVTPLTGWTGEAVAVAEALADAGFPPAAVATLDTALAAVGRRPLDYSSKFRLLLDEALSAADAARAILGQLFSDLERNEDGTRGDIDPEFLHDYRVAVRRTRSALSAFRPVLGEEVLAPFAEGFRELGRLTGDKRNLDVHLLDFEAHLELLDAPRRNAMAELRRDLELRRDEAGRQLAAWLKSPGYRAFKRHWRNFLAQDASVDPGTALSVKRFADQTVWGVYRKLAAHGRAVTDDSPDEVLHDLRKRGKKLRYLMEFFQSLYPAKPMKSAIAELKALQDQLGLFQDQCVQIETLEGLRSGAATELAISAIDDLVEGLARQREETRRRFSATFGRFDAKSRRALYRGLFRPAREKH